MINIPKIILNFHKFINIILIFINKKVLTFKKKCLYLIKFKIMDIIILIILISFILSINFILTLHILSLKFLITKGQIKMYILKRLDFIRILIISFL